MRVLQKHLRHNCRLPSFDFRSLPQIGNAGAPLHTTNIPEDLKNIQKPPLFEQLLSLPKCPLLYLGVYRMPFNLK